jgi:hypothetical protein
MASIVSAGTTSATALNMSADTTGILQLASNNGTVAVTVDTSQRVGIGKTPGTSILDIAGEGQSGANNMYLTWSTTSGGYAPAYNLRKSNGTKASPTAVVNDDELGAVVFAGYDGSNYQNGAYIQVKVDSTPGTNDMPARMAFFTSADGSASPTERMRIASTGLVSTTGSILSGGYVAGAGYYRSSGMVNETVTVTTEATVYSMNKDSGSGGSSSSSTYNITGLSNTDGSSAIIYVRNSNTAGGINTTTIVQIHGTQVWQGNVQNTTKTASFGVFRQNGAWQTTAWSTGAALVNVW